MPLSEFDNLSRKRISRIITIQEKKLEKENEIKQQQLKEAERRAANNARRTKGSQRVSY